MKIFLILTITFLITQSKQIAPEISNCLSSASKAKDNIKSNLSKDKDYCSNPLSQQSILLLTLAVQECDKVQNIENESSEILRNIFGSVDIPKCKERVKAMIGTINYVKNILITKRCTSFDKAWRDFYSWGYNSAECICTM